ncbi:rod shape-determining protein MreD [Tranquillimonas alkanivorans]|uniref:Rod shape-determining protein MreD n=1 Tax=Tranquillimonas alkanivorans TaxID=441119 RepID=A0A1I5MFF0_9RHOB|nr:rod shape-determining protein MreD [Tranquillimonas alkanivorans]SFP08260.1 rod shape-determining protein MreD [Tranquillimonas alkanivorans]
MVDPVTTERWGYRALFAALAALVLFIQILPFQVVSSRLPGPDLLVVLAFVWVLRRPDYVPTFLVAAVVLAADILQVRPIGLWAGITVLGLEFLRAREHLIRDLPFMLEWAMVAGVLLMMKLAYVAALGLFMVPQPPLRLSILQVATSVLSYPVLAALSRYALGVFKRAPGEVDALGHRR